MFRLFVYGTLKRRYRNFSRYAAGAERIEEALLPGQLYQLRQGYPAAVIPKAAIYRAGTADLTSDLEAQELLARSLQPRPLKRRTRRLIGGEILHFADPEVRLPAIDRLEGFQPSGPTLYRRVLTIVETAQDGKSLAAWAYVMDQPPAGSQRLRDGRWPSKEA